MSQEPKKISRRQVIKLLTASAGAATMANLPNKWVKPVLNAGVLPAHAQNSSLPLYTFSNGSVFIVNNQPNDIPDEPVYPYMDLGSSVTISPVIAGVQIRRTITVVDTVHPLSPNVVTGYTDTSGTFRGPDISLEDWDSVEPGVSGRDINFLWEFVDPSDGTDTWSETVSVGRPE